MATDEADSRAGDETAAAWSRKLADDLGVSALELSTQAAVLSLAREVAHGSERKYAPLATFIAGRYLERRARDGVGEAQALGELTGIIRRHLDAGPSTH